MCCSTKILRALWLQFLSWRSHSLFFNFPRHLRQVETYKQLKCRQCSQHDQSPQDGSLSKTLWVGMVGGFCFWVSFLHFLSLLLHLCIRICMNLQWCSSETRSWEAVVEMSPASWCFIFFSKIRVAVFSSLREETPGPCTRFVEHVEDLSQTVAIRLRTALHVRQSATTAPRTGRIFLSLQVRGLMFAATCY